MNGREYLEIIQAKEMSKEELMQVIKKLYEDNWAISKQCDTLENMINSKKITYEKEFIRELVIRKYANSELCNCNIYNTRKEIDINGKETGISCPELNYLPVDNDRLIAEINADWDLLPIHRKIMAYIGYWFDNSIEYLRGIWGNY